jgi:hypothetical protein
MAATVVEAAVGSAEEAIVTDTASSEHALSGIQLFVHWAYDAHKRDKCSEYLTVTRRSHAHE